MYQLSLPFDKKECYLLWLHQHIALIPIFMFAFRVTFKQHKKIYL